MILHSASEAETVEIGRRLGASLAGGDLVLLSGDLGAGKTRLVTGMAAGLGVEGDVSSPTFVIERIHPTPMDGGSAADGREQARLGWPERPGRPPLHHLDLYRVSSDEIEALDIEASLLAGHAVVVEWGEKIAASRRHGAIAIQIDFVGDAPDSSGRILRLSGPVPAAFTGAG